jgi:hypothetical protein
MQIYSLWQYVLSVDGTTVLMAAILMHRSRCFVLHRILVLVAWYSPVTLNLLNGRSSGFPIKPPFCISFLPHMYSKHSYDIHCKITLKPTPWFPVFFRIFVLKMLLELSWFLPRVLLIFLITHFLFNYSTHVTSVTQILKQIVLSFSLQYRALSFNLSVLRYPQNSVLHSSVYYFSQLDPSFTTIQTEEHITYICQTSVTEIFFIVVLQAFVPLPSSFCSILFSFGSFLAKWLVEKMNYTFGFLQYPSCIQKLMRGRCEVEKVSELNNRQLVSSVKVQCNHFVRERSRSGWIINGCYEERTGF